MKQATTDTYDAIVIGSGMGGLTTASLLAQVGRKRVLVLEKHFKLGGFTHSFRRKDYEWDVGVHYVGEMQKGALSRQIMDLVTGGTVDWAPMGPTLERYVFPGCTFDVPSDEALFQQRLIERFPAEEAAIRQYFRDMRSAQGWMQRWFAMKAYPRWMSPPVLWPGKRLASTTTADYMRRFKDPLLPAILTGQWPDFGAPPAYSAFAWHGTVAADFLAGGYYPVGGAKTIAEGAARVIEQHGGACLVNHGATEVLLRGNRAVGVAVEHKGVRREFHAPVVISNAGAVTTFTKLLPPGVASKERARAERVQFGPSALVLFLGMKGDPRDHGFTDCNYWVYDLISHDTHARVRAGEPQRIDGVFLSFGSLRNPGQTPHTAQVITFPEWGEWSRFEGTRWLKRGDDYEEQKRQAEERILDFVERFYPGFRGLVDYQELSTPLTVETFTDHPRGVVYGQLCDKNRLFRDRWDVATSVRRLFLTGSDVGSPGVNGALFGGAMAAGRVLGISGIPRIMMRATRG